MASSELQVLSSVNSTLAAGRSRRKPRESVSASPSPQQQPTGAARMPLNIPIGRRSTGAAGTAGTSAPGAAGTSAAEAGPSTGQQQQDRTTQPRQQGQQRCRQASAKPSSDVIIVDSDSDDDDDDVVITGFKPAPKRPRLAPPQQPAAAAAAGGGPQQPAGQRVERGLHGGYFVMPTWSPQDKQQQAAAAAAPAPPPREASPEPLFKCLICLDGIKPDNMGITPCGHMFCYNCILEAVKATKKCPKCRKGVTIKGLKRIYPN